MSGGESTADASVAAAPVATGAAAAPLGGRRFGFGKNWRSFLGVLSDERIREAERSLVEWLGDGALAGRSFLDIGCGSGLFSLAAHRLGAARVHSFDYDADSVACAAELRRSIGAAGADWTVERGDVLDSAYLERLGRFDVVYSWGVLHHTGDMWRALDRAATAVTPGGRLFIAIYNDEGFVSTLWTWVKRLASGGPLGWAVVVGTFVPFFATAAFVKDALILRRDPRRRYAEYQRNRGMSLVHDWLDWIGGYPFEVATPARIEAFFAERGFAAERIRAIPSGHACNEFLFRAPPSAG